MPVNSLHPASAEGSYLAAATITAAMSRAGVADGTVAGFGLLSYELALRAVAVLLAQRA